MINKLRMMFWLIACTGADHHWHLANRICQYTATQTGRCETRLNDKVDRRAPSTFAPTPGSEV